MRADVGERWVRRFLWVLMVLDLSLVAYGAKEGLASVVAAGAVLAIAAGAGLGLLHQPRKTK